MQHIIATDQATTIRRLRRAAAASILAVAVTAQVQAEVVEPAPSAEAAACAPAELAALRLEVARARQEIAALRATGMEMQQSLEARDAALADLRGRNAALMAAADERAQGPADVAVPAAPASPEAAPVAAELAAVKSPAPASVDPTDVPAAAQRTPALLATLPGVELTPDSRLILTGAALFPPGQAQLSPDGRDDLRAVAERLRQAIAAFPAGLEWTLHIDGHTDDTPIHVSGFASNTALSVARAQAVADYLASRGLPAARLAVGGFGATRPLAQGSSPSDRARNRRIELRLTFP